MRFQSEPILCGLTALELVMQGFGGGALFEHSPIQRRMLTKICLERTEKGESIADRDH
jgi:hypothetical protein